MIARWLFIILMAVPPAWAAEPANARTLTIRLWATQSVTRLTATPLNSEQTPLQIQWLPGVLKQQTLSGSYRMQSPGAEDAVAAGQWTIARRPDGLRVLLTLPSEDYVIAALDGEAAPDEPMASLKAMAVAARTYALGNANRHRIEGFGLCDTTHCQALRLGTPRPEVERAVHETAGETLWYRGRRAQIYYTQHCGGMSEPANALWPKETASYLSGSHADPYCLRRQPAQWHAHLALSQLDRIFQAQGWHTPSPIAAIRITKRSPAGRAELLEVSGRGQPARLSAGAFRFAVDRSLGWNQIRSDWYEASMSGDGLDLQGRGYGHGVGLCQAGAWQMAAEHHTTEEILGFYFPGTIRGLTPAGRDWQQFAGAGWTLLTTSPQKELLAQGNAAWVQAKSRAQPLLGDPADGAPNGPWVQELPSTELFRQTTHQSGWTLAATRGNTVFLQPAAVRRNNGGTEPLLLHEFLHVLVEREAGEKAPLWLREGLVEMLAHPANSQMDLPPASEVEEALAHPVDPGAARRAHRMAAQMVALLCNRYGLQGMRQFLHAGVPANAFNGSPSQLAPGDGSSKTPPANSAHRSF